VKRQHRELKKQIEPIIENFRDADDLSKGKHLRQMERVEVPFAGKYENLIAQWLRDFYRTAVEEAAKAAEIDPPKSIPNAVRTWLAMKAQAIGRNHGERLRGEVLLEVLEIVRKEIPTSRLLWNVEQRARQRANLDLRDDLAAAGNELTDLINSALSEIALEDAAGTSAAG